MSGYLKLKAGIGALMLLGVWLMLTAPVEPSIAAPPVIAALLPCTYPFEPDCFPPYYTPAPPPPDTFIVNSSGDAPDASLSDGLCAIAGSGLCTLRAAINQVNALAAGPPHSIRFSQSWAIVTSGLPSLLRDGTVIDGSDMSAGAGVVLSSQVAGTKTGFIVDDANDVRISGIQVVNFRDGIVLDRSRGTIIGTNSDGVADGAEGVTVRNNAQRGIWLTTQSTDNVIAGNRIGTDSTGATDMGNANDGILMSRGSMGNRIGTDGDGQSDADERNVISGNDGDGIELSGSKTSPASENIIAGNYIGIAADGMTALPNTINGILLAYGASNNLIGSNSDGSNDGSESNRIHGNGEDGVHVIGGEASGNAVLRNSIFGNGDLVVDLGIDLWDDGINNNDSGDDDPNGKKHNGPNHEQNYPIITAAQLSGGMLTVEYTLDVDDAEWPFRVEFFLTGGADASGHGEGLEFICADASVSGGVHSIECPAIGEGGTPVVAGAVISATATNSQGGGPSLGSTSEFGPNATVLGE